MTEGARTSEINNIGVVADNHQYERRKKIWNKFLGWGVVGMVGAVGVAIGGALLYPVSFAAYATSIIVSNLAINAGWISSVVGIGGRLFDRPSKVK